LIPRLFSDKENAMSSIKIWAAFAVGVAAGACVALLYAPQSGEATRRQIRETAEGAEKYVRDAAGKVRDKAEDLHERAHDYVKRGRDVVDDLVESARKAVKA